MDRQGAKHCEQCSTTIREDALYCSSCGSQQAGGAPSSEGPPSKGPSQRLTAYERHCFMEGSSTALSPTAAVNSSSSTAISFQSYIPKKRGRKSAIVGTHRKKRKKTKASVVQINIGMKIIGPGGNLKSVRGDRYALNVAPDIRAPELLRLGVEKLAACNRNFDAGKKHVLLYEDGAPVKTIPGYPEEPFTIWRYKQEIGREYRRITLYVRSMSDLEFEQNSDRDSTGSPEALEQRALESRDLGDEAAVSLSSSPRSSVISPASVPPTLRLPTSPSEICSDMDGKAKRVRANYDDSITEMLIEHWRNAPMLYDKAHANYSVREDRHATCSYIADQLNQLGDYNYTGEEVNVKLKDLRDQFIRLRRNLNKDPQSTPQDVKWKFYASLHWLNPFLPTLALIPYRSDSKTAEDAEELEEVYEDGQLETVATTTTVRAQSPLAPFRKKRRLEKKRFNASEEALSYIRTALSSAPTTTTTSSRVPPQHIYAQTISQQVSLGMAMLSRESQFDAQLEINEAINNVLLKYRKQDRESRTNDKPDL